MPATARQHFQEDCGRARAIVAHTALLPRSTAEEKLLRSDLLRSAWMFAVGALDAYFCDAYTDVVAATIISKSRQQALTLPDFFYDIKLPIRSILEPYPTNVNWRWRMAARKMMERENVLSLDTIQKLFNKFFRNGHRFFGDCLPDWIQHPDAKPRLFGIKLSTFNALAPQPRTRAVEDAKEIFEDRYKRIFQRRHDCIHNCDRPKVAPQPLALGSTVLKVVQDVEFLVHRCDDHINSEFREFLRNVGCMATTIAQAGY